MKPDAAIIEKIQKLLSLANSDNEHEAKMATQRANALLLKYNLDLQQITDHQNEYVVESAADTGLTLKPHQMQIAQILMDFFFVRVLIHKKFVGYSSGRWAYQNAPRSQYQKVFQLVGTRENCKIAGYIFSYLNEAYPKLWKDKYERNAQLTVKDRTSYYMGLTIGIKQMLEETRFKVEQETGLVLQKDPKLDEFLKSKSSGSYGSSSQSDINPDVVRDGIEDGRNITLRKPIESQTNQDTTKRLSGRDKT